MDGCAILLTYGLGKLLFGAGFAFGAVFTIVVYKIKRRGRK